jgi:hypothetical protein
MAYWGRMKRLISVLVLTLLAMAGIAQKLWLKDGTWHVVREYSVQGDRIRYFSSERAEWEEIPLEMVDLDKTRRENAARAAEDQKQLRLEKEEDTAERNERKLVRSVPVDPGAYIVVGENQFRALKQVELKLVTNRKRSILKAITPIPLVAGKQTLETDGEKAAEAIQEKRPGFYVRLANDQLFTIIQLTPGKGVRLVETIQVMPVTKEKLEERKEIACFRQQLGEKLFKLWPEKDLAPGEYAVIEYTDGEVNPTVREFRIEEAKPQGPGSSR